MSGCGGFRVGTAGWTIPPAQADAFHGGGSHLERYARVFGAAEINSSFHRPHRPQTYARWAASVPDGFRFSAKLPREVTHTQRLVGSERALDGFLAGVGHLGDRLGPLLIQLPPSLVFEETVAVRFLAVLRERFGGLLACEPRHPSWFGEDMEAVLVAARVARVAADPARVAAAARPGGWPGLVYRRLHGSPRIYSSPYGPADIVQVAADMRAAAEARAAWCIFDNTQHGAATPNALQLDAALRSEVA